MRARYRDNEELPHRRIFTRKNKSPLFDEVMRYSNEYSIGS